MKTKTINLYEFNELSKEAKERAINEWYEHEDFPFLTEDLKDALEGYDIHGIFSNVKLQYSLSYSQGDGLSFSGNINLMKWLKLRNMKTSVIDAVYNNIEYVHLNYNSGRYSFCSKNDITYEVCYGVKERLSNKIDQIIEEITEYYIDICNKLEKYGYSVIEYRMNDEEFQDLCEANGYTFLANGKIEN